MKDLAGQLEDVLTQRERERTDQDNAKRRRYAQLLNKDKPDKGDAEELADLMAALNLSLPDTFHDLTYVSRVKGMAQNLADQHSREAVALAAVEELKSVRAQIDPKTDPARYKDLTWDLNGPNGPNDEWLVQRQRSESIERDAGHLRAQAPRAFFGIPFTVPNPRPDLHEQVRV